MIEQDTTKQDMILDKIRNFHQLQRKVHITKIPSYIFPNGKWHNGTICQYLSDKQKIIFLDDMDGAIEIFFWEIGDVGLYKEKVGNGNAKS